MTKITWSAVCAVFVFPFALFAQNGDLQVLAGKVTDCGQMMKLFRFEGFAFEEIQSVTLDEEGRFRIEWPVTEEPAYLYLGPHPQLVRPFLVTGREDSLYIQGSCKSFRQAAVRHSTLNRDYELLKQKISYFKTQYGKTNQLIRRKSGEEKQALVDRLAELDQEQLDLLDSLQSSDPFLANVFSLNMYLSYVHNRGAYANEVTYYANEYFKFADFSQPQMERSPWVYEGFKGYTKTLAGVRLPNDQLQAVLKKALGQLPQGSGVHRLALSGVMVGLKEASNANFPVFAEAFIQTYGAQYPDAAASLEQELAQARQFMVGGEAPDFSQRTPEGENLHLSDLRGKVVLLDFWASWCGPCRRENPNVVKLYEKYKDQGFTVLGVSLDRNKEKWLGAIAQDGLDWHHVSDLKGWSNEVAQQYQVRSIPHTFLLDQDGKIIGVKLRGQQLEAKLEELFGTP